MVTEVKPKVNQEVVEMLEDLLDCAKKGEIQGIAVAGAYNNAVTFNCFSPGGYTMALLGEHRVLERDMIDCKVVIRRAPMWEYCE